MWDGQPAPRAQAPPFGLEEILHRGLLPPIHDRQLDPSVWLDGYARTHVERDVRQVAGVGDLGRERIPVEAKSGETVAPDVFDGLDAYTALSKGSGGILVQGGSESYLCKAHQVRAWWACS